MATADAVRNYETLSQSPVFDSTATYEFLGGNQEFEVVKRKNLSRCDVRSRLRGDPVLSTVRLYDVGPLGFRELDRKRLDERQRRQAFKNRFSMALFGGVALLVPVLIMALRPGLVVDLVTTSVATVLFAVTIAVAGRDASGKDVLASTAAYTAVLVVFVGTTLGMGSSGPGTGAVG